MKKVVLVLGIVGGLASIGAALLGLYLVSQREFELNQKRTEPARMTRLKNLEEQKTENENEKKLG